MLKSSLFKQTFILLFAIGVADFLAHAWYLYWTVWWFDVIMHFSAGFCVAMASVLIWQYFFDKNISLKKSVAISFLFVLTVGLMWEIFETFFGIEQLSDGYNYVMDTVSDLILDICGGILGSIYAHKLINK